MIRFSSSLKFAALSAVLVLGACTHKQEAVTTPPPPVAAPAPAPAPVASGILPGSAEDLRVNVGVVPHVESARRTGTDMGDGRHRDQHSAHSLQLPAGNCRLACRRQARLMRGWGFLAAAPMAGKPTLTSGRD